MFGNKPVLSWFFILLFLAGACEQKPAVTILTGRLPDYKNERITLIPLNDYFPGLEPVSKELLSTQTDSAGNFIFRSDKINSGFYQVTQRNYHRLKYDIYLEAGDSLFIEQEWQNHSFVISGKGALKLQHLVNDNKHLTKQYDDTISGKGFENALLFKSFIDSAFDLRMAAITADTSFPQPLKRHSLNGLYAEKAKVLLDHLERRNFTMSGEFTYHYPDSSYYSFLADVAFDENFSQHSSAKSLAQSYLTNQARYALKNSDEEAWWKMHLAWRLKYVAARPPSAWNDLLLLSVINEYSFGMLNEDFFGQITSFDERAGTLFSQPSNLALYRRNVLSYLNLAPGKPAPDFALPDSSGNPVKLSDFRGKIVYVDVWGTWCGPCLQQIPEALKLQESYKDKPVVFLYVALEYDEKDITRWRKFIAGKYKRFLDKPFPGVHVVAEKQFGNEAMKPYKINFAPTHMLIDQNGTMVNPRAAGAKDIANEIDQLLENLTH
ncbi:MAG: TlpA family protein disulfide reductase [Cyclobacteriaceae bacterium]|jgi:thiol-disulfide isomerase/thioredoxin|nr:TlpA family protein disulfide reductase [Cyclobacteriaceae bacterium]